MNEESIKQHIFQTAGLGLAPYKFLGVTENLFTPPGGPSKPGGCCDYCGTSILYEFHLSSADGKEFKVGSDCICKAGDAGLKIHVSNHKAKLRRIAAVTRRHVLQARKIALVEEILLFLETNYAKLKQIPHPWGGWNYDTGRPRNWIDYAAWMVGHCGVSALLKLRTDAIKIITP